MDKHDTLKFVREYKKTVPRATDLCSKPRRGIPSDGTQDFCSICMYFRTILQTIPQLNKIKVEIETGGHEDLQDSY